MAITKCGEPCHDARLSNAHHTPDNAVGSACIARSHEAVIRVYDSAAKVIERHEHKGDFKESHGKGFMSISREQALAGTYHRDCGCACVSIMDRCALDTFEK